MNIIDICTSDIFAILIQVIPIPDMIALKLLCKRLYNFINIPLQIIREIHFFTSDKKLMTYEKVSNYIISNNFKHYLLSVNCKLNNSIDTKILSQILSQIDHPNIKIKTSNRKNYNNTFHNSVDTIVIDKTETHFKVFKNGAIIVRKQPTISDFYDSINKFINILDILLNCKFKINTEYVHVLILINCKFCFADKNNFFKVLGDTFENISYESYSLIIIVEIYNKQRYNASIDASGRAVLRGTNYEHLCDFHSRLLQCLNM